MSIFVECTIYNSGQKIMLNLDQAQAINSTDYHGAKSIVSFADSAGEPVQYYVLETYEELRAVIMAAKGKA